MASFVVNNIPGAVAETDNSNNQFAMIPTGESPNSTNSSLPPVTDQSRDNSPKYTCKICNYVLSSKRGLDVHSKCAHSDERTFLCDLGGCRKRFRDAATLKKHQATHVEDRPFQCGFPGCKRRFSRRDRKTIHQRSHTGEKPYICKDCGKAFACKVYLNVHRKYHLGSRQHSCDFCDKAFVHKGDLNKHKKIVHGRKSKGTRKSGRKSGEAKRETDSTNVVTRLSSTNVGQQPALIPPVGEYLLPPNVSSSAVMQSTPQTISPPLSLPPPVVGERTFSFGQTFSSSAPNVSSFAPRQSFAPALKTSNFMAQAVSPTVMQPRYQTYATVMQPPQPVGQALAIQTPNVITIPSDVPLGSLFGNAPVSLVLNVTPTSSFGNPQNVFRVFPF